MIYLFKSCMFFNCIMELRQLTVKVHSLKNVFSSCDVPRTVPRGAGNAGAEKAEALEWPQKCSFAG